MDKFTTLTGIAAPIPFVNIHTDMIISKQFLKTIKRSGLGMNLFEEMRYDREGHEMPDFVLNKPNYRDAQILIAGGNFGGGSSREHAPWALLDFDIRCDDRLNPPNICRSAIRNGWRKPGSILRWAASVTATIVNGDELRISYARRTNEFLRLGLTLSAKNDKAGSRLLP